MRYISTRGTAPVLDFEDTLLAGLARDKGLYVPEIWPSFSKSEIEQLSKMSYSDLAVEVMMPFVGNSITREELNYLAQESYSRFDHKSVTPLRKISQNEFLLELFHGPTLAFKDCAMQFLCRAFDHILRKRGERLTIICATSGDTGAAAIEACKGRNALDLFVLFPEGRVSSVQQKQMTVVESSNIFCIALQGTFDDCQAIVKQMFEDNLFRDSYNLSAVNSINWARVMAQIVYYFYAALQLGAPNKSVSFSVPTGNFGDIFAGYVATKMGLPIEQLCIATNCNDILPRFVNTGSYEIGPVISTYSPSMDIQVASNFERLLFDVCERSSSHVKIMMEDLKNTGRFDVNTQILQAVREIFVSGSVTETETLAIMKREWEKIGVLIDPHTAVGVGAGRAKLRTGDVSIVYLATAHPAKFPEAVIEATGKMPKLPAKISTIAGGKEHYQTLPADLDIVKAYIAQRVEQG